MSIREVLTDNIRHGIVHNMDKNEYFRTPGLNPSTIVYRRKSALAAKHAYEQSWSDSPAKLFGRCCHSLLFEGHRFYQDWAVWPEHKRRYGKEWDEFQVENAGKEIIKDGDGQYGLHHALKAIGAATKHRRLQELVTEGLAEVALFTEEQGLQCRGRMDWLDTRGANLVDAKFTNDITPSVFGRSAASFGYRLKMACYKHWFERESGKSLNGVYLLTIEVSPPYDVAVVQIPDWQLEDAWAQSRELIRMLRANIEEDHWPGVDEGNPQIELDVPMWDLLEKHGIVGAEDCDLIEWGEA